MNIIHTVYKNNTLKEVQRKDLYQDMIDIIKEHQNESHNIDKWWQSLHDLLFNEKLTDYQKKENYFFTRQIGANTNEPYFQILSHYAIVKCQNVAASLFKIEKSFKENQYSSFDYKNFLSEEKHLPNAEKRNIIYTFRELSLIQIQRNVAELPKVDVVKYLSKKSNGLGAIFLSALNPDPKVFAFVLSLYKIHKIPIEKHLYADKNKIINVLKETCHIRENTSIFDYCLANNKLEIAKILEKEGLNKSKVRPFECGGMVQLLALSQSKPEYKKEIWESYLNNCGYDNDNRIDDLFQYDFVNSYDVSDIKMNVDYEFLFTKNFLNTHKKQAAFFDFLNHWLAFDNYTYLHFATRLKSVSNINYYIRDHSLLLKFVFKNLEQINTNFLEKSFKELVFNIMERVEQDVVRQYDVDQEFPFLKALKEKIYLNENVDSKNNEVKKIKI